MTQYFNAYGLTIKSKIDLLIPTVQSNSQPDVTINFGSVPNPCTVCSWDKVWYGFKGTKELTLKFDDLGVYLIREGREVIIDPVKPIKHDNIRQPILGTVMAMILHQRGSIVLHGSAVFLGERVVVFIGWKGQGKSTLAAAFNADGHPLISDDVCAVDRDNNTLKIQPSFPRLRLNPDVLAHLGDNPANYPRAHPEYEKRVKDVVETRFCNSGMPVGAICNLEIGAELKIEQVSGMEAVKVILAHMLVNRFPENRPKALQEEIFFQSSLLAKTVPVFRLTRPKDLNQLQDTAKLLKNLVLK